MTWLFFLKIYITTFEVDIYEAVQFVLYQNLVKLLWA